MPERSGEMVRQARRRSHFQPEHVSTPVDAGAMSRSLSDRSSLSHVAHPVAQRGGTPARILTGFPVVPAENQLLALDWLGNLDSRGLRIPKGKTLFPFGFRAFASTVVAHTSQPNGDTRPDRPPW